jgi:putative hemolysin
MLTIEAADEGEITEVDRDLIDRVFRFGDRRVDDVMVPRPDIVAVDRKTSLSEALEIALRAGHRRLPVFVDDLENIQGVVRLRDLIAARDRGDSELDDIAFEPLVVPESKRISNLLEDMQARNNHMAVVVDEYGVTVGLVTIEDVAEELLGSIADGPHTDGVEHSGEGVWRVVGSTPVEDLSSEIGVQVPDGDWNTAAGLMLGVAGRLLDPGATVDIDGFEFIVRGVRGRRITLIEIKSP